MVKEKDTIFHWIPTLQILSVVFHLAGSTNDYTCTPAMMDMLLDYLSCNIQVP